MTSPYRSNVSYKRLLNDCWGILSEKRKPVFPRGSRAAPSPVVYVFPNFEENAGYWWSFWEDVVAPVLIELAPMTPQCEGGWANPTSVATIDASLRAKIASSTWANKVDFSS